jgi:hypothetical protein
MLRARRGYSVQFNKPSDDILGVPATALDT